MGNLSTSDVPKWFPRSRMGVKKAPLDTLKLYWGTSVGVFKRLLRSREKFDFIIIELPMPITKGASSVYSYFRGSPVIIDFGDLYSNIPLRLSRKVLKAVIDLVVKTVCHPAELITVPISSVKRHFESILKREVFVIPHSVDTEREFNPDLVDYSMALRLIPREFDDKKIVLFLGEKGCEYLVHIAKEVILQYGIGDARFLVVGSGEYSHELVKQVNHAGLMEHFFFAGACPYSSLPMYISLADVTLALVSKERARASLNNLLKVVDFMSMGKPVVAMGSLGMTELIENGRNGFVTALKNVGFYTAKLLSDDDLCRRMGRASRERCAKRFDNKVVAARLISLLQSKNHLI